MVNSNVQFCQSFWLFLCCISVLLPIRAKHRSYGHAVVHSPLCALNTTHKHLKNPSQNLPKLFFNHYIIGVFRYKNNKKRGHTHYIQEKSELHGAAHFYHRSLFQLVKPYLQVLHHLLVVAETLTATPSMAA